MAGQKSSKAARLRDEFFVGISQPQAIRVHLLGTRKIVLESMKLFKEIKSLREEKRKQQKILHKQVRAINSNLGQILECIPHIEMPVDAEPVKQEKKIMPLPVPKQSPVDHIESQLAEIEQKLAKIQH